MGNNAYSGVITSQSQMFSGGMGGRWATERFMAALKAGRNLGAAELRTLDTLLHEEWKFFDTVLLQESLIRLTAVADLIAAGCVKPVNNAIAYQVFGYQRATFFSPADISMSARTRTNNDRQEFDLQQLPLPITHKDFSIDLRVLATSRLRGESLDTSEVRAAGRVVAEAAENMLINGGPTFSGMPIYGYTTHPNRLTDTFDSSKGWGDDTKTGVSYLKDVLNAVTQLQSTTNRHYGPYVIYVPTDAGVVIENDYNPGTANIQSIRERLLEVSTIKDIRVSDQLASNNVLFVQMTEDVASWINGEPLQTVQWDVDGGFLINFKAWQIGVPLIRADAQGRSGIFHMHS